MIVEPRIRWLIRVGVSVRWCRIWWTPVGVIAWQDGTRYWVRHGSDGLPWIDTNRPLPHGAVGPGSTPYVPEWRRAAA